jgi:hypothetical protein
VLRSRSLGAFGGRCHNLDISPHPQKSKIPTSTKYSIDTMAHPPIHQVMLPATPSTSSNTNESRSTAFQMTSSNLANQEECTSADLGGLYPWNKYTQKATQEARRSKSQRRGRFEVLPDDPVRRLSGSRIPRIPRCYSSLPSLLLHENANLL